VDQLAIRELKLAVEQGVLLVEVVKDSPADKAGLKKWDVITSFDGQEVISVEELTKIIHASTIGQPLEVKYWRGDKEYTTQITPIESPRP
jgi:serine protease Do